MVFGSGNKFRIRRSHSKASYLAARREREHGLPTADIGSYKRTMSPSGGGVPLHDTSKDIDTPHWTVNHTQPVLAKDSTLLRNNNNTLLRRTSLVESKCSAKKDSVLTVVLKPCPDEKQCVLPDVLPVNAKVSPSRASPPRTSPLRTSPLRVSPPQISPTRVSPPRTQLIRSISEDTKHLDRLSLISTPPRSPASSTSSSSPIIERNYTSSSLGSKLKSPLNSPKISPNVSPVSSPKLLAPNSPKPTEKLHLTVSKSPVSSPPSSPVKSLSPVKLTFEYSEQPKVIEGLQMIQRTEVTLRVNTCTIDAASQTEKEELPSTPLPARRKLQEEIECERLSQDLVNHLSPSDRLKCILVPGPEHKKPSDYVSGLFKVEVTSRPRPQNSPFRSRNATPNSSPPPSITSTISTTTLQTDSSTTTQTTAATSEVTVPILETTSPLSATSTYFTTSESKAKFLTRYSRDMNQYNIVKDTKDLNQKKEELVNRLDKKLEVLRGEQLVVSEECRMNDELGENVERHVSRVARPHEAAKFRLHVEEVGKITSLLLGLSGRLARVENALMGLPADHSEKKILEGKRDKLQEQLEEAKKLKESIDKRSVSVSNILYKYLSSEEYSDYDHFINMKAKLIMDSREISDKIKLGEEQLSALKETLAVND